MITFTQKGSFRNAERYLNRLKTAELFAILNKYGSMGAIALASATPVETGLTSGAWSYTIVSRPGYYSIRWHNDNYVENTPLVILLQYGHGTGTGGYVPGIDFINPAIQPIFERMLAEAVEEVRRI